MASSSPAINETKDIRKIVVASSVGTLIGWYDLYIYGSLATVIAGQFYPQSHPTAALLATLATFAAGFIVRPFGAFVFGRLGDLIGRKYTFLLPLIIMSGSTFVIGLIPGYAHIGFVAPLLVLLLRLLQGLALGGEFGGAATYVAEHAPGHRRGFYTSWIQAMGTAGLFVSLGVILLVRHGLDSDTALSVEKFNAWGWRIPFLFSIILMAIPVYIRLRMQESPLFQRLKSEDRPSAKPLTERFGRKTNWKIVLLALFGVTMGQGVVFYAGQFYAQSFLETVCNIDFDQSKTMLLLAILLAAPFFVVFGGWSDRVGRKWIMMAGMLLAVLTYPFLFRELLTIPGTEGRTELVARKEIISSLTFIEKGKDIIHTSNTISHYEGGLTVTETAKDTIYASGKIPTTKPLVTSSRTVSGADYWKIAGILFLMVLYVAMVFGPGAALLMELFPARIRHPSMSLSDHIGNGIIGGMTPFVATLLTATYTGHPLAGLWYPIGVAAICVIIGVLFIPNRSPNVEFDS
jgi:MFS family permease